MDALLNAGLANALIVLILAPLVAIIARVFKKPAVSHALWLILLLKLVSPPWIAVPIMPDMKPRPEMPLAMEPAVVMTEEPIAILVDSDAPKTVALDAPQPSLSPAISWQTVLAGTWLAGSTAWLILAVWRVSRFAKTVRLAQPANDVLQSRVAEWAARIGLRRAPELLLVSGRISPMVWAFGGRARLLVPESFWKRLDAHQQEALVIHELAHLRRMDHWVRPLEMLTTGLFWWHPALWWTRRGLHEAEEQCCDLWVVWAMPGQTKTYASTLVEAVDFLCEGSSTLPLGASGMGQVHDLSRRIGMIMRGTTPRAMSRSGWLAMLALTAMLLPLRPSWSQQPKAEDMPPPQAPAADPLAQPTPTPKAGEDPFSSDAKARLKLAESALQRVEGLQKRGFVSDEEVDRARSDVAAATRQVHAETVKKSLAISTARDEIERLQSTLTLKDAIVARATAQLGLAKAEMDRIAIITKRDRNFVSKSEENKAMAEVEIANAEVRAAQAEKQILLIEIKQATQRLKSLEDPFKPPPQAPAAPVPPPPASVPAPAAPVRSPNPSKELGDLKSEYVKTQDLVAKFLEQAKTEAEAGPAVAEAKRKLEDIRSEYMKKYESNTQQLASRFRGDPEIAKIQSQIAGIEDQLAKHPTLVNYNDDPAVRNFQRKLEHLKSDLRQKTQQLKDAEDVEAFRRSISKPPAGDAEQRLKDVEQKLDRVLEELEALRKQKSAAAPSGGLKYFSRVEVPDGTANKPATEAPAARNSVLAGGAAQWKVEAQGQTSADRRKQMIVDPIIQKQYASRNLREVVRLLYISYFDRAPTAAEMEEGCVTLEAGDYRAVPKAYLQVLRDKP